MCGASCSRAASISQGQGPGREPGDAGGDAPTDRRRGRLRHIEVKKDLAPARFAEEAVRQLAGYVSHRTATLGQRYVGILTDGADWRLSHLASVEELAPVSRLVLDPAASVPTRAGGRG
jgi:hypothetical protein